MKSYGGLFERIVDPANLAAAVGRAAKGKTGRDSVREFLAKRESEVEELRKDLASGEYRPRPYTQFRILDPKPRSISCADFRDRVVHHAVCAVLAPLIERRLVEDNYACRRGKGSHRAILRARGFARRFRYFLKTDIRAYYASIDHELLLGKLHVLVREPALRRLLESIVRHPLPGQVPGRGLPIGSLTSQWFGNFFLDEIDHWLKEVRGVPGYVRYMDDLACWSDSKEDLRALAEDLGERLRERLGLELKRERTIVAPCSEGIPFLGWRVFPGILRMQGNRLRRRRRLLRSREEAYVCGKISAEKLQACARALDGPRAFLGFGEPLRGSLAEV